MPSAPHEPPLQDMSADARAFLASAKVPHGPFDPDGPWKQSWAIQIFDAKPSGKLVLTKKASARWQRFDHLLADWRVQQTTKGFQHMVADAHCLADDLGTPISWQAQSRVLEPNGEPIEDLTVKQEVQVKDGVLELFGGVKRFSDQPLKAWSCTWSMLEAVQRLGGKAIKPMAFTLLEYMDARKNEQSLFSVGSLPLNLGGRQVTLQGYRQIGQGIMPMEYWLDEQQRVVMMLGRQRLFLAIEEEA